MRCAGEVRSCSATGGATSVPCSRTLRLAVAVLALGVLPARAQTIAGRVLDQVTRQLATPVGVRVIDDSGLVIATASTNESGVFYADLLHPARVRIILDLDTLRAYVTDTLTVGPDDFVQREFLVPFIDVFLDFQVERPAASQRSNVVHYPLALKGRNEPGSVLAQFIVDTTGRARMTSFRVLSSTHPDFTTAVQQALPGFRFLPAVVNGHKVAQLVQQPFEFAMGGARDAADARDSFPPTVRGTRSRPVP